jgi:transposase
MSMVAKFVGLDVHKASVSIAVAEGPVTEEVKHLGSVPHDVPRIVRRLLKLGPAESLRVAYEAGPTGYGLCRALRAEGIHCEVVAPSRTPVCSGDRVKTDRRDAEKLARYFRSGELVAIDLPDVEREALRDLVRAREDATHARHCARQQLSSFLLRHGRIWPKKSAWTRRHVDWIRSQRFDIEEQRQVLEDYFHQVMHCDLRLAELTNKLALAAQKPAFAGTMRVLQALRGVSVVVAATLVAEIGDLRRFATAARFMSYLGLTPSEHSSGPSVQRGSITKAGNAHARRVLVEAAWCARRRPAMSTALKRRSEGVPQKIQLIAWKAQERLYKRFHRLVRSGKSQPKAIIAVARELSGFVWAIGQEAA